MLHSIAGMLGTAPGQRASGGGCTIEASIQIRADPIGRISPRLYGTLAEHLGRCCYDGLWVGPSSQIPNVEGSRANAVDGLRDLPMLLARWPGGCDADNYHWRKGIGSPAERPSPRGAMTCHDVSGPDLDRGQDEVLADRSVESGVEHAGR